MLGVPDAGDASTLSVFVSSTTSRSDAFHDQTSPDPGAIRPGADGSAEPAEEPTQEEREERAAEPMEPTGEGREGQAEESVRSAPEVAPPA
ncbi:MAG: hypothetical protein WBC28_01205, partial [Candidatus Microthrix parvicella]